MKTKCPVGATNCKDCNSDGLCVACNNESQYIRPDQKGCLDACPPSWIDFHPFCLCEAGYHFQDNACVSTRSSASLSAGTIIGIISAILIVGGALAGFLIWRCMSKKRR